MRCGCLKMQGCLVKSSCLIDPALYGYIYRVWYVFDFVLKTG